MSATDTDWFQVDPDPIEAEYTIDADRPWSLPAVYCRVCRRTWGNITEFYPNIDLSTWPDRHQYRLTNYLAPAQFEVVRKPLVALAPPNAPLYPGTGLGPLQGEGLPPSREVVWADYRCLLMVKPLYDAFIGLGVRGLAAIGHQIVGLGDRDYVEVYAPQYGMAASGTVFHDHYTPCSACGYVNPYIPRTVVARDSVPPSVDVFRLREMPTVLIVTGRFKQAVELLAIPGFAFTAIEVR